MKTKKKRKNIFRGSSTHMRIKALEEKMIEVSEYCAKIFEALKKLEK